MFRASARSSAAAASEPGALGAAVRAAWRFDRQAASASGGLLAAIPVTVLLGGGIALGQPVAAVTMGAGAMLVGIAWRTSGGRPPLALMATDAALMAVSTFVGCVTGSVLAVHLAVLCLWSLAGGLLVALGARGAVLGTQAIISVVVFGRFSEPAVQALGLAAYVFAGGLAQVLFLGAVRWPAPLRGQRRVTAAAYQALAELAPAPSEASTLPAATALDSAQAALASGALLGDAALVTLRSLVNEGFRLRVQLSAIHALLAREPEAELEPQAEPEHGRHDGGTPPASLRRDAVGVLELTGVALGFAARAIEGDPDAGRSLASTVATITAQTAALAAHRPPYPTAAQLARRFAALAGQLRAIGTLAPAAGIGGGVRSRRPQRRTNQPLERLRGDLDVVRANASLASPAGRHALRLAIVVPAAALISRELPLQRGYWMVVAAATVLRPEFGATFTRGTERALGTALGVAMAGAIAALVHPAGGATVVLVAALAWAGYSVFPASFAVGFAFITALVVFLLNAISPDTWATASARLLDTLVGGSLGLIVYAVWPTWSDTAAQRALAQVVDAQRAYIREVLAVATAGRRASAGEMTPLSRRARLARTNAEATVAQSLSDPATRRIDAGWSQGILAASRRLVQAAHVLRLDAEENHDRQPLPRLQPLADGVDAVLGRVESRLEPSGTGPARELPSPLARAGAPLAWAQAALTRTSSEDDNREPELPNLRDALDGFAHSHGNDGEAALLLDELDEIVDATHGLAALVGIDPAGTGNGDGGSGPLPARQPAETDA